MKANENNNIIPIVFAVNNDYTYFGYVAICSLIKHIKSSALYRIYIFVTDVDEENRQLLESLSQVNVEVKCLDISEFTKNITLKGSLHLSIETYYRLFIPIILPEYKKIIYLDSDICVLDDVAELYNIDMEGYSIAAVPDVPCEFLKNHTIDLGLPDCRKTFNAGVLLIDTFEFEKQKVRERCLKLLEDDYKRKKRILIYADQDALNTVMYDDFLRIDKKWNCQWQYLWRKEELFEDTVEEYFGLFESPSIIHFAGDRKPWFYPDFPKANVFWEVARTINDLHKFVSFIIRKSNEQVREMSYFSQFQFPFDKVRYRSEIILYGAGVVGKAIREQLEKTRYAKIVGWVDKGRAGEKIDGEEVISPETILECNYDYILIAIEKKSVVEDVKHYLCRCGVDESKIIWDDYRCNRIS